MTQAFVIHLLRHGAPDRPGRMLGHTDEPATAEGIAACIDQADGLEFSRVVTSDLRRAFEPAQAIASARGLPLDRDTRWRELDFGAWDGLAPAEIDAKALAAFWKDPSNAPPPGGERWSQLVDRVGRAIAIMPPQPTLIVTHAGAMRAALALLCGFSHRQTWSVDLPYNALLSLAVWPGPPLTAQIVGLYA